LVFRDSPLDYFEGKNDWREFRWEKNLITLKLVNTGKQGGVTKVVSVGTALPGRPFATNPNTGGKKLVGFAKKTCKPSLGGGGLGTEKKKIL